MYIKGLISCSLSVRILLLFSTVMFLSACAPKVEREFKSGCKSSGGSRSFCNCVYEQLEKHYGAETLQSVGEMKRLPPADFTDRTLQYSQQCAYKMQ